MMTINGVVGRRLRVALVALASTALAATAGIVLAPPATAASLVEVTGFGDNPGGMRMHVYVPDSRPTNPAIVVAMHGCGGSGPGFYSGSEFASQADRYGFVVIYPTATQQAGFGNCFDVWSAASKRRGGGSDPVSIMSMVAYVQRQYGGDPDRVYATGSSSGGMMTNAMLALYPDVFKAGAAFMGVPFNCFANAADFPPQNSQCVNGRMDRTPQQWGDAVRQAYPGYSGARPRIQLWHGTNDTLVPFQLLQEAVDQWTNVHGLSLTPTSTDTPQANWNRRRWTSGGVTLLEAISVNGAGHSLPMSGMAQAAVQFFGLDGGSPTPNPTTGMPTTSPSVPPTTTPPPSAGACRVGYTANSWTGGFTASVTVANTSTAAVNGWTVQWNWPGNQQVTNAWNATVTQSGPQVTARNVSYNAAIGIGASVTFGVQGTYSGANQAPTQFTLNGAACSQ
ncbi:PHB depolymerase family esterase [Plantactinospora sp. KLBMP9567]|uniref:extracellular catalytic domain type 1 short-chain-length polyhydroxyalkanoate depolymerase n=1 Tax=Plantactinospora sp. KLBMP9567 TaxID=3085900 RepID=UPI0029811B21|nr:PHB depolymerase family esterase [Plantactinospora sp. KLBMP9567]MDW5326959.1 PHB depolymerase family esterase [Plantactinospora sp. KLBMP9567]